MFIKVNNTELFYSESGQGKPIILLHGNDEDHHIFDALTPKLAEKFTVYALDSRAHGKSAPTENLSYSLMAEDVVQFIRAKQINAPILYGFSDGGIVGLLVAKRCPDLLSRLIISGANSKPKGLKWHWRLWFRLTYFFKRSAKMKLMLCEPDITKADLQKIEIPTLVLAGENDIVKLADTHFIAENIKNSTLRILAKENHDSYVAGSEKLYEIMAGFMD